MGLCYVALTAGGGFATINGDHARPRRGETNVASSSGDLDQRVAALLAAGNTREAASEALRELGPGMLRYLSGLLGDTAEAEEAFSMAGERLWHGLSTFRGESALKTWAFRLAWSAATDLRKSGWNTRRRRLDTDEAEQLSVGERTESWLREERLRLSLEQLRAALPLEDQSLLRLRIDQELSWRECAEVLSSEGERVSADAAMKRFERIKDKLRELVQAAQ